MFRRAGMGWEDQPDAPTGWGSGGDRVKTPGRAHGGDPRAGHDEGGVPGMRAQAPGNVLVTGRSNRGGQNIGSRELYNFAPACVVDALLSELDWVQPGRAGRSPEVGGADAC